MTSLMDMDKLERGVEFHVAIAHQLRQEHMKGRTSQLLSTRAMGWFIIVQSFFPSCAPGYNDLNKPGKLTSNEFTK